MRIGLPAAIAGAALWRLAAFRPGQPVERQDLAVNPLGLFRRHLERERRAVHFDPCGSDRLARLERDHFRELLAALGDRVRHGLENRRALP